MNKIAIVSLALAVPVFSSAALAQQVAIAPTTPANVIKIRSFSQQDSANAVTKHPQRVQPGYLQGLGAKIKYSQKSQLSAATLSALRQMGAQAGTETAASSGGTINPPNTTAAPPLDTVPFFTGSFSYQGASYPYDMIGGRPERGLTTKVSTSIVPVSLYFDGYVDSNGNNIVIDSMPILGQVLLSPNFQNAEYSIGNTQFADAVQRAEHKHYDNDDWHTLLRAPRILTPVQIEVPVGDAQLYLDSNNNLFAVVDANFFYSQLNTISQLEPIGDNEIPIILANNTFLGDSSGCCVLGFHTAYQTGVEDNKPQVQVFAFATWADSGIFTGGFQDVTALSHEIAETINDPFVNNIVPPWQYPDGSGTCGGSYLETGDPVEVLPQSGYAVTVDGFTYHPQTEALLQWFARTVPSNAFDKAYSYPDTSALTKPSVACAP